MSLEEQKRAYLRGELSLAEAKAFEAELAREGHSEAPMPDDTAAKVGAALQELDAVEARRAPIKGYASRPWEGSRRAAVGVIALLAAAAIALLVLWAWPRGEDEPRIAVPGNEDAGEVREPLMVPPPTRLVERPDVVAPADVAPEPEVLIAERDVVTDTAIARFVDNAVIGARDGRALTIDLVTTPLGRGAEWRKAHPKRRPSTMRVARVANMTDLVTAGLLHQVVACLDDQGTSARSVAITITAEARGKSPNARVAATSPDPALASCVERFEVSPSAWRATTRADITFDPRAPIDLPVPDKGPSPGKRPVPGKGKPGPGK